MIQPVTPEVCEETPPRTGVFLLAFNSRLNRIFCRSSCFWPKLNRWHWARYAYSHLFVTTESSNLWLSGGSTKVLDSWMCAKGHWNLSSQKSFSDAISAIIASQNHQTPQSQCHCLENTGEASTGLKALYKREILHCCLLIFQVKKLQRLDQNYDGNIQLGLVQSSDPQGKFLARIWTSASGEAFKGVRKTINLLARRRKSLYPWCRDGIRRNYDLTSE